MNVLALQGPQGLVLLNIVLAVLCGGALLAVTVAALLDVRERRRWRALVPPCWPPPGVDAAAAYASDPVPPVRRSTPSRPSRSRGGESR